MASPEFSAGGSGSDGGLSINTERNRESDSAASSEVVADTGSNSCNRSEHNLRAEEDCLTINNELKAKGEKNETSDEMGHEMLSNSGVDDEDESDFKLTSPLLEQHQQQVQSNDGSDSEDGSSSSDSKFLEVKEFVKNTIKSISGIYGNQTGSFRNICQGVSIIFSIGTILGIAMPKDQDLPTHWYRILSSIIGYTYFMSWSVSYYPQLITNFQRKSVSGLSTDYVVLGVLNCTSYAIYNCFFYWDKGIRKEYEEMHGGDGTSGKADASVTVQSNDVAYSIHAVLVMIALTLQVAYYGGFHITPSSNITKLIISTVCIFSIYYMYCITILHRPGYLWINFLYILSVVKILLSSMAYVPQIMMNYQRKSTVGFNIWNILLDFLGGVLSMTQLILDSIDLSSGGGGFRSVLMGNCAKLVLGIITLFFDSALLLQHYVLYRHAPASSQDMEHGYSLWEDQQVV